MKDERFEIRLPAEEKEKFYEACKKRGETPSEVLRRMMTEYTHLKQTS